MRASSIAPVARGIRWPPGSNLPRKWLIAPPSPAGAVPAVVRGGNPLTERPALSPVPLPSMMIGRLSCANWVMGIYRWESGALLIRSKATRRLSDFSGYSVPLPWATELCPARLIFGRPRPPRRLTAPICPAQEMEGASKKCSSKVIIYPLSILYIGGRRHAPMQ